MVPQPGRVRSFTRRLGAVVSRFRLLALIVLGVVSAILGWVGYTDQLAESGLVASPDEVFYRVVGLFGGAGVTVPHMNPALNVARFGALIVTLAAVAATILRVFRNEFAALYASTWRSHAVVVGLGGTGVRVAVGLRDAGYRVVAIEQDAANPNIGRCWDHGITVLIGAGDQPETLDRAGIAHAALLYALTGDDARNARIAATAREIVEPAEENRILETMPSTDEALGIRKRRDRHAPLTCFQRVDDPLLARLLTEYAIMRYTNGRFQLEALSTKVKAASLLLSAHPSSPAGASGARRAPEHVVVVGTGDLPREIVSQLGRQWHERGRKRAAGRRRVTAVGSGARAMIAELETRYPRLRDACKLDAIDVDLDGEEFARGDVLLKAHRKLPISIVYTTANDDARCIRLAIRLREKLERASDGASIPVVACVQSPESPTANPLPGADASDGNPYGGIILFGMLEHLAADIDALTGGAVEQMAREIHAAYLVTLDAFAERGPAAVPWADLPRQYRESNRRAAADIGPKLSSIKHRISPLYDWDAPTYRFDAKDVDTLARAEHDRWWAWNSARKVVRSDERNETKMRHPDVRPFEELSDHAKRKDIDSVLAIPALLHRLGFRIVGRGADS